MRINKGKTNMMVIDDERKDTKIEIVVIKLEQVRTFQYLGVLKDEKISQMWKLKIQWTSINTVLYHILEQLYSE